MLYTIIMVRELLNQVIIDAAHYDELRLAKEGDVDAIYMVALQFMDEHHQPDAASHQKVLGPLLHYVVEHSDQLGTPANQYWALFHLAGYYHVYEQNEEQASIWYERCFRKMIQDFPMDEWDVDILEYMVELNHHWFGEMEATT